MMDEGVFGLVDLVLRNLSMDVPLPIVRSDSIHKDFYELRQIAKQQGFTVIWIDRLRPMNCKRDVMDAFDTALGIYYIKEGGLPAWDGFAEDILMDEFLPGRNYVWCFSELSSLQANDPKSFEILLDILNAASQELIKENRKLFSVIAM